MPGSGVGDCVGVRVGVAGRAVGVPGCGVGDCVGVADGVPVGVGVRVEVEVGVEVEVDVGVLVGRTVSVSVAELLPGVGSVMPAGAATVAVLESVPLALGEMPTVAVYVTDPPRGRLTVSLWPEPLAVQVPPPAPTHVQLTVPGKSSLTVDPGASLGPAFDAVTV